MIIVVKTSQTLPNSSPSLKVDPLTLELCLYEVSSDLEIQIEAYTHIKLQMKVEMSFPSILDSIFITVCLTTTSTLMVLTKCSHNAGRIQVQKDTFGFYEGTFSIYEDHLSIRCISTYSPPTQVVWKKYGEKLNVEEDDQYHMRRSIWNRYWSVYYTSLYVFGSIEDIIGNYSCTMINLLGSSKADVNIRGSYNNA